MPRKRYKPEEIVAKLRQVDVLVLQGQSMADAIRQIGVSEVPARRTAQWRDLLHATRSQDRHRELASSLQCHQAPCPPRLQTTSTGGLRARILRVAGFTTSTGSARHAGAKTSAKLTSDPDHSMKAGQPPPENRCSAIRGAFADKGRNVWPRSCRRAARHPYNTTTGRNFIQGRDWRKTA
jgi:hypothetical protein